MINRLRSLPRTLLAILVLWVSLLLGASLLWPVGYGYDEASHVDMAYTYSTDPFHYYGAGQLRYTKAMVNFIVAETPAITPTSRLSVAPIAARSARPTLEQLGGAKRAVGTTPNQMVQHPPAYYYLEALLLSIPGVSSLSAGLVIWLMRLVSVAIMAPVPLLCWDAARRLLPRRLSDTENMALLAAVVPVTIPALIRDGAAVNNDTLLILATSFVLAMLARVIGGDRSIRTAAYIAGAVAVALWTKGFALALPLVILLAYLVGGRASRPLRGPEPRLVPPLAVVAAGCAAGSFWWVRNLVLYGTVQTNGFGMPYTQLMYGRPVGGGAFGSFLGPFLGGFITRIWGQIGIPVDQPSTGPLVVYGWAALAAVGILIALLIPGRRRARAQSWALFAAVVAIVGIVMDGSFNTWRTYHTLQANQGRYVYSAIVSVAGLVTTGFARVSSATVMRWATPTVLIAAVATNAWSWVLVLRSEYQPGGRLSFFSGLNKAVDGVLRWAPTPDRLTIFLVLVLPAFAAFGAIAVSCYEAGGRSPAGRPHARRGLLALTFVAR